MNKRGQGMSTNTIILLILGIIILVVLVLGFALGWDKIAPWLSKENVSTIVNQCEIACATGDTFGYCTKERTLNDGVNPKIPGTCNDFSIDTNKDTYSKYDVKKCAAITCPIPAE